MVNTEHLIDIQRHSVIVISAAVMARQNSLSNTWITFN